MSMTVEAHTTIQDWRLLAACISVSDPDRVFFPIGEEPALEDVLEAKAVCATCGVRPECLVYAIETHQSHGIWGGLTAPERSELISRMGRRGAVDAVFH
jgi:WhiB family transcriptional regulator, redox-sensing transcriptional regulator